MADNAQSANSDGEIDIKVKTMQPATYELTVPVQVSHSPTLATLHQYSQDLQSWNVCLLQITVAELKQRLVEKANIPQERQRIIYKGRVLDNDQRLEAHGGCANTAAASSLWLTLVMTCWQGRDTSECMQGFNRDTVCIWLSVHLLHLRQGLLLHLLKSLAKLLVSLWVLQSITSRSKSMCRYADLHDCD